MVDNKSKTPLIRHIVLHTRIILLSSFVIYFFCIRHSGRFPIVDKLSLLGILYGIGKDTTKDYLHQGTETALHKSSQTRIFMSPLMATIVLTQIINIFVMF